MGEEVNIIEALKSMEHYVILQTANGRRWMYWDNGSQAWVVRGSNGRGRNKVLIETESEEEAIEELLK